MKKAKKSMERGYIVKGAKSGEDEVWSGPKKICDAPEIGNEVVFREEEAHLFETRAEAEEEAGTYNPRAHVLYMTRRGGRTAQPPERKWVGYTSHAWIGIDSDLRFVRDPDHSCEAIYDREEDVPEGLVPTLVHIMLLPAERSGSLTAKPAINIPVESYFERLREASEAYFTALEFSSANERKP